MVERLDVRFAGDGQVELAGWLYLPRSRERPLPAITMANGFGMTRLHGVEPFAEAFARAGFAVLLHDHRNFGESGGNERYDIDPWQQVADWRFAISYLENHDEINPDRIGIWGADLAGGHALVLAASDRRVRAVVAQVPTISGFEQARRRIPADALEALEASFEDDDRRRFLTEEPLFQRIVSADPRLIAAFGAPDAVAFYERECPAGTWENRITVRSVRATQLYEPGAWVARVAPTPLMMVVARNDTVTMTDLTLAAYGRALEPKRLVLTEGGHFAAFGKERATASVAAAERWFREHLKEG